MKTLLFVGVAVSVLFPGAAVSHAADAMAGSDQTTTVQEIIVTAEKRAQKIDQVPVAITAFTSQERELIGLDSIQDYSNFTPGLSYSAANDRLFLRGVGRETNTVGSDPGVATYVDGVYNSATVSAAGDELFIDRAEILRGPQGTLYGRNSIGGAINAISKRPTDTFQGELRATAGNYGVANVEGAISGPIVPGLRFRLAAYQNDQTEGYFKNLAGGPDEGGRGKSHYVEGQLDARIGDRGDVWVKVFTQGSRANPRSTNVIDPYDYAPFPVGGLAPGSAFGYLTSGYSALGNCATNPGIKNPRNFCTNTPQTARLKPDSGITVNASWRMDGFDVKYIGGYQSYDYKQTTELDNTAVNAYSFPCSAFSLCAFTAPLTINASQLFKYEENKDFQSHEIDFTSTGNSALQWVGGLYYYHEDFDQQDHFAMPNQAQILAPSNISGTGPAPLNPSGDGVYANGHLQTTSYAIFAQADWALTTTLKLTGGLRYTDDKKSGTERFRALCLSAACVSPAAYGIYTPALDITASPSIISYAMDPGVVASPTIDPATGIASRRLSGRWSATTGTAGISWTPDRDTLAYGRYSRGYKSGGFNAGGISASPETAPEYVDSLEIGVKHAFGRTLEVNLAAFRYDYANLQVPLTVNTASVAMTEFVNIKEVVSQGVEMEMHWQATPSLQFLLSYGYLDATVQKGCCYVDGADPYALQPSAHKVGSPASNGDQTQSIVGQTVPESPRNKIAVNGNYTFNFAPGTLNLSASGIWKDATYDSVFNRPYNKAPSYDQVDLRATWTDIHKRYSIIAFVKNSFDSNGYDNVSGTEVTPSFLGGTVPAGTVARTVSLTPPRTYGVQLQYRF
jgi:iron complex outermembrane recepter protein